MGAPLGVILAETKEAAEEGARAVLVTYGEVIDEKSGKVLEPLVR